MTAPAVPRPATDARRPRMRRPAHEPEPVTTAPPRTGPGDADDPLPGGTVPGPRAPVVAGARPPGPDGPPVDDVRRRAAATVRAMVEVLAGRRSPAHLAGVARPEVLRYLTASRTTGRDQPVTPARVHVALPTERAAEIVAVCRFGDRSRALTVRLDRDPPGRGHAWRVTAVRLL